MNNEKRMVPQLTTFSVKTLLILTLFLCGVFCRPCFSPPETPADASEKQADNRRTGTGVV